MTAFKPALAGRFAQQQPIASVLAVVPDVLHAAFLYHVLDRPNLRVACVTSGRDALRYLWRTPVDVVICDEILPDGSWRDLVEEISNFQEAPTFLLACARTTETVPRGVDALLGKPYDPADVSGVVNGAVRRGCTVQPPSVVTVRALAEAVAQ